MLYVQPLRYLRLNTKSSFTGSFCKKGIEKTGYLWESKEK